MTGLISSIRRLFKNKTFLLSYKFKSTSNVVFIFYILLWVPIVFAQSQNLSKESKEVLNQYSLGTESDTHPGSHFNSQALSEKTFVPEKVRHLKQARLLWFNFDYFKEHTKIDFRQFSYTELEKFVVENFAWGIPSSDEVTSPLFDDKEMTLYADRYGGTGLGDNRGSGRAARSLQGKVEWKGLGRTSLVAQSEKESHSNGRVPLNEALREALYGEATRFSPHGSNRVLMILSRGSKTVNHYNELLTDALIIREQSIRPAHFIAVQNESYLSSISSFFRSHFRAQDRERTTENVKRLKELLPDHSFLSYCRKIAEQFAYLYANHFYHGATSESNIELSGRLIDYGTMTAQPGYGKLRVIEHNDEAGKTDEFQNILVERFLSEIKKFAEPQLLKDLPRLQYAKAVFQDAYRKQLRFEFLALTGIPKEMIPHLTKKGLLFNDFADYLIEFAKEGAISTMARYDVPEKLQKYELGSILTQFSQSLNKPENWESILIAKIPGNSEEILMKRKLFLNYYQSWREALNSNFDILNKNSVLNKIEQNAFILNQKKEDLYRWKLMDEFNKTIRLFETGNDPQVFQKQLDQKTQKLNASKLAYSSNFLDCIEIMTRSHEGF